MTELIANTATWLSVDRQTAANLLASLLGTTVSMVVATATIYYVNITRKSVAITLSIAESTASFQRDKIRNDTMIDLARMWASPEFISARMRTIILLDSVNVAPARVYGLLKDRFNNKETDHYEWQDIALIAHFIARFGQLLDNNDIDLERAKSELLHTTRYWSSILIPIYYSFGREEQRLTTMIRIAVLSLTGTTKTGVYPFYKKNFATLLDYYESLPAWEQRAYFKPDRQR